MEKTISVIIPIYNVEKYLPQCMESVLNQSYRALEIILIDDGSPDGSGRLCDQYAAADSRIRVIHQKNGGAAAAKNAGLRTATGEYLAFLDSDDYLEPDAYRYMVGILEETGADAVQCSFRNVFVDGTKDVVMLPQRQEFSTTDYLKRYTTDWTCGILPDKLYRRCVMEGLFLTEGHVIDDEYFSYQVMMNATRVVHDPKVVYNYRQRKSGAMRSPASAARLVMDKLDYLTIRLQAIRQRFPELRPVFDVHYLDFMLRLSKDPFAGEESLRWQKELLRLYGKQKNATLPPVSLWPALAYLRFGSISNLLKKRRPVPQLDFRQYFD